MQVTVVSVEKCGATPPTIALIKEMAGKMDIVIDLTHVIIRTPQEAKEHRHIGSPTIQVEGRDIDPEARNIEQFGVT